MENGKWKMENGKSRRLRMIERSETVKPELLGGIIAENNELCGLFTSSLKTARANKMKNGKWKSENEKWKMENEEWKIAPASYDRTERDCET